MSNRPGIALLLALLVVVLIEAMSAGIIALATQGRLVAASQAKGVRAQAAAEAAVQNVLARWQRSGLDTLAPGQIERVPVSQTASDELVSVSIERLRTATYLVRSEARVGGGSSYARARATAIARTLDRAALIAESNNAIASGGPLVIAGAANVRADAESLPSAWSDSLCPATEPLPPAAAITSARAPAIGEDAVVAGPIDLDTTLALTDSVALGGVRWSELAGIADRIETGTITPSPVTRDSVCVTTARGNWGDPRSPGAGCGEYLPLIFSDGDLVISGGEGQGILAVAGTLTITGSFEFAGIVVARDGVTVGSGANLLGALRSRAGYALIEGSQFFLSHCAVARAALRTPSSVRLILAQRRFIPAF